MKSTASATDSEQHGHLALVLRARASSASAAAATGKAPTPRAAPFSLCAISRRAGNRLASEPLDQTARLAREKAEHFGFQVLVAHRLSRRDA